MKHVICYLAILLSCGLLAQKKMTPDQLKKDLFIFENIIKEGHPALHQYIEKSSLDSLLQNARDSFIEEKTDLELYKTLIRISDQVRDGHLVLDFPQVFDITNNYFPLLTKIIYSELYTDTDDFEIDVGSKILSINGIKTSKIMNELLKYAPTDGYNTTRKYREIESNFGLYYSYEYGSSKQFIIDYETPEKVVKTITLPSEPLTLVKQRNIKRNSYFARYHKEKNGFDFFTNYINPKRPFVYYVQPVDMAVLVVHSFQMDHTLFTSQLTQLFKQITKKKTKHLVIDIRQNDGGLRSNAIQLFSYVTKSFFKQRTSSYVAAIKVPEPNYIKRKFFNEKEYLTNRYKDHITMDGWQLNFDDLEALMIPIKERFQGNVYVLTGGATYAAGATFAQLAKNDPNILLIGEETGGGYYTSTGDFPVLYELPNSEIRIAFSMASITNYVKDTSVSKGSGIPPDRNIYLTQEDLILGRDPVLDYVIRLIAPH